MPYFTEGRDENLGGSRLSWGFVFVSSSSRQLKFVSKQGRRGKFGGEETSGGIF